MKLLTKILIGLITLFGIAITSFSIAANQPSDPIEQASKKEVVVLIHGLGRSNVAMWRLASYLEDAGYAVHRVGYSSFNTTQEEVIADVSKQINDCCANESRPVHFVGHSLGGLLIRAYLQENKLDSLGRVVMMGTPNNGTGVADYFKDNCLINLIPIAAALGTDEASLPNQLDLPYYPVGIIAGLFDSEYNEEVLPGQDDGMVPVESTKLEGMADFIVVESGHSMLRYNPDAAYQTTYFLRNGKFRKEH